MAEKKVCFVIAPIGEEGSETRIRSDQVLKYVITLPVEELGYEAIRADRVPKPGLITSQVIEHVLEDPLVIADLTGWNPNVFYELAIRHAIRKPLVQIIRTGEEIPFDVAGMRTISVDHNDLDSVDKAKSEIKAQVKALEEETAEVVTPISVTLDLQMLRRSEDPEGRSLGEILAAISEVRTSVVSIERAIYGPEGPSFGRGTENLQEMARYFLREIRHKQLSTGLAGGPSREAMEEALRCVRCETGVKDYTVLLKEAMEGALRRLRGEIGVKDYTRFLEEAMEEALRRAHDDKSVDEGEPET